MKKAIVFYFSGTGNTELVAEMLSLELEKRQYTVKLVRMEDVLKNKLQLELESYDLVGIGSQVIGFGAPSLAYDFIKLLPHVSGQKAFVFRTAGGVAPINYNASKPMIRRLTRKGYNVFYERIFSLGSNWIAKFDDEVILGLHEATRKKVSLMCDSLAGGERRSLKTGLIQRVIMECVMFFAPRLLHIVGKDLKANESCSHCGLCVKNCPAGNIIEKNGKINFKMACNCCMRCVYSCPKNAIHFRAFSSFAVPGGYNLKKILSQPKVCAEGEKKPEPKFFAEYLSNSEL